MKTLEFLKFPWSIFRHRKSNTNDKNTLCHDQMSKGISTDNESPDMFGDYEEILDPDLNYTSDPEEMPSSSSRIPKAKEYWRGVPMCEIYRSKTPWSAPEFPLVSPAYNHAVLYHIPKTASTGVGVHPPVPQQGRDIWDREHVRMPYSKLSLYPVQESDGSSSIQNRWDMITEALLHPISNSRELESAILKYNTKYQGIWKFTALHKIFDEMEEEEGECFFNMTLPAMIDLALKLPQLIPSSIPLLRQHHNRSVTLSQQQIACLLANAFFCTFPRRNTTKQKSEYSSYPDINFYRLFQCAQCESVLEKLKCFFNYFRRVCKNVPCGVVTFTRRTVEASKCPEWSQSSTLLGSVPLHINSKGTIEDDGLGLLQVDFANKFLGGGVLGYGCVQEEIRFVICPELMVSMLFTEVMKPTEALLMIGCERYNNYCGYAENFQWSGDYEDATPYDTSGRRRCAVIAIDALCFNISHHQYRPENITRELNKAWVGYSVHMDPEQTELNLPGVATGNWGCGAFNGSPYLKALIQLMACCQNRRPMVYFTFKDSQLRDDIIDIYNYLSLHNITVGELYKYLCQFSKCPAPGEQLYPYLVQCHKDSKNQFDCFKNFKLSTPVVTASKSENTTEATGSNQNQNQKKPVLREALLQLNTDNSSKRLHQNFSPNVDSKETESDFNPFTNNTRGLSAMEKVVDTKIQPITLKTSICEELTQLEEGMIPSSTQLRRNTSIPCFEPNTSTSSEYFNTDQNVAKSFVTVNDEKKGSTKSAQTNSSKSTSKCENRKISDYFQRLKKK